MTIGGNLFCENRKNPVQLADFSMGGLVIRNYLGQQCFEVYDLFKLPALFEFDYIFVRSLSLYNTKDIEQIQNTTETLMTHLKKNGLFIFCYNVNFNIKKQSDHWKFHNLDDINYYFSNYQSKVIYFSSKLDCILLGKFSFNKIFSYINMFASKLLGLGGEIVCFIKK